MTHESRPCQASRDCRQPRARIGNNGWVGGAGLRGIMPAAGMMDGSRHQNRKISAPVCQTPSAVAAAHRFAPHRPRSVGRCLHQPGTDDHQSDALRHPGGEDHQQRLLAPRCDDGLVRRVQRQAVSVRHERRPHEGRMPPERGSRCLPLVPISRAICAAVHRVGMWAPWQLGLRGFRGLREMIRGCAAGRGQALVDEAQQEQLVVLG